MTREQPGPNRDEVRNALADVLRGAKTEHEQLEVLSATSRANVELPADGLVVGEPVQVTAIEYGGNARAGLRATVRRRDERYDVNLADVTFNPGSQGARFAALYRAWLGIETPPSNGSRPPRTRRHKAEANDLDLGDTTRQEGQGDSEGAGRPELLSSLWKT